jgi:23S rRNA (guanine2535-N1)-methyltransferase
LAAYKMTGQQIHGDLASGWVLHSAPGFPAFPVRLAEEMFLRSIEYCGRDRVALWDPCCGSGYLVTALALLRRVRLTEVICSDISTDAVALASRNLRLLTDDGLTEREQVLRRRAEEFGKRSYAEAAEAAVRLRAALDVAGGDLPARAEVADAFDPASLSEAVRHSTPDLVITDVPYGRQTGWAGSAADGEDHIARLVEAITDVAPHAIVAVCASARKIPVPGRRTALSRFRVGSRAVLIVAARGGT